MGTVVLTIFKLLLATLLPVVLSCFLYYLERNTRYGKINYWLKQLVAGILFGGIAVLSTVFGIPVEGAVLNVRNAAPLTAGLLFGGPAGILVGMIGGIYRWYATYWGAGAFSQTACSLGCMLAGFFGAGCRKFMFDNKKASWFYGFAIGGTTEVLHMLLLFVTNMNDIYSAYRVVSVCAVPMILCNAVSVMLSLLFVSMMGKERVKDTFRKKHISQVFQFLLLICVMIAFSTTLIFTNTLQTEIAYANVDNLLEINLDDVEKDIEEASDENLLRIARQVASKITSGSSKEELESLLKEYNIAGINIVNASGIVVNSTLDEFVGFDMSSGKQSSEFLCLLRGMSEFVQSYQALSVDSTISRKYAGIAFENGGFVQVGYDAEQFQSEITEEIRHAVTNRHIGKDGGLIVSDEAGNIIYDNGGHSGESIYAFQNAAEKEVRQRKRFDAKIGDVPSYCMFEMTEGFYLIANIPKQEAMFSRDIAVTILAFMETLVFAALFAHIYFLIKNLIVDNIHKINQSLSEITGGNLTVQVNVRGNEEFASLSDDINATVDTLKHYIKEAESRMDQELEFARQIQHSSLPGVFPPYPDRCDFDIFASMNAAKEVGGDFYDFCLLDSTHLMFLVADVSGKGIPGALFMMRAKTLIRNLIETGKSIDEVFTEANKALCENNEAEMFVTAWMGVLNTENWCLEYVNAGHNPPLIRHQNNTFSYLRTKPNFILAGLDFTKYKKHELQLTKGDEIFLYTDGVTEAVDVNNHLYGEMRLEKVLSNAEGTAQELCEIVHKDIDQFVEGAEQSDDITMLCVKINDDHVVKYHITPDQVSVEKILGSVETTLHNWDISQKICHKVQIVVDELYSNIVLYSGAENVTVLIQNGEKHVVLALEDDGKPYDPTKEENPDINLGLEDRKIGGLGIFMVKKLTEEMKYTYEDKKNRVEVMFLKEEKMNG